MMASATTSNNSTSSPGINPLPLVAANSTCSSMFFVVNPLPSSDDDLNDKILETAEKLRSQGNSVNNNNNVPVINFPSAASTETLSTTVPGKGQTVLQCVVSRNHVAVLFDDHRVCRFPFTIYTERINSSAQTELSASSGKKCGYHPQATLSAVGGGNSSAPGGSGSSRSITSRRRMVRRGGSSRSSASVIMNRNPMIPAQYVPEELVNQAQVVLQGKSRNLIIRELQRTNLDVNLAVNNLLSRDDEDFDDADDSPDQLIHSEDLMSLLDSGFQNDHSVIIDPDFNDEVFTYPLRIRSANSIFPPSSGSSGTTNSGATSQTGGSNAAGGPNSVGSGSNNNSSGTAAGTSTSNRMRFRDEAYSFIERDLSLSAGAANATKRWYTSTSQDPVKSSAGDSGTARSKKSLDSQQLHLSPISLADQQELWPGSGGANPEHKFVQIAALHSELIAINSNGQLCQWRWADSEPFKAQTNDGVLYYHPRAPALGLLSEKISLLAASMVRATVVTESNKLATWMDESIAPVASKLEHSATNSIFTETLAAASSGPTFKISSLYVSSLMSCVQLSSGPLFWWGTPPFSHRKKVAEKGQTERSKSSKGKPSAENRTSASLPIVQGSLVCMRNAPIYQAGAIAFTTVGGVPKVGYLLNATWKMNDSCSFRVLTQQEIQNRLNNNGAGAGSSSTSGNVGQGKNLNLDRSEMPPPPSPASSTSSESSSTNAPITVKRARGRNLSNSQQQSAGNLSTSSNDDKNSEKTEMWNLRDVVFVEDTRNMPIGRVIKVDGGFVAVKFQNATTSCVVEQMVQAVAVAQQPGSRMNPAGTGDGLTIESYIQDCRLLRKEDLIAVRHGLPGAGSGLTMVSNGNGPLMIANKTYDCFQRFPKRVPLAEHMQILAMTLSNLGLHAIAKIGGYRFSYLHINIVSGRIEHDNKLSIECSTMFVNGSNPKSSLIRLFSAGENEQTTVVMCRDGNGTLYPLAKDCTNTVIREPIALNLGPVTSIGLGVFALPHNTASGSLSSHLQTANKTHAAVLALSLDRQYLMPAILTGDLDLVRERLTLFESYPAMFHSMIGEVCDGNHNILHIAVSCCFPISNKPPPPPPPPPCNDSGASVHVQVDDEDMERCSLPPHDSTNDNSLDNSAPTTAGTGSENTTEPVLDPTEQKPMAHSILWTLLDSTALSRHLFDLLSARDYQGLTPFMLAINGRAYSAAQQIFVVIQRVARMIASNNESNSSDSTTQDIYQRAFTQMLYPRGSSPDHSPLYMLCSNDTCSFTWTGEVHINQDIFECKTCGLIGSLCCCTECARVCHRGHDCKLKRTSPTAYCDCWEKCKCKALIAGCQPARYQLLKRLLAATDLSQRVNSRGEHILLFLVQTVGRQIIEQKQYRPSRARPFSSSGIRTKSEGNEENTNVPEHDLEPPKFARRVLEKMLGDWPTVKSMILTGYRSSEATSSQRRRSYLWNFNGAANTYSYEEENSYLACQNGSALLDKFTHLLLKIGLHDAIDRITCTIVQACRNQATANEGRTVARRFLRSVIRVSLVVLFETNPVQYSVAYLPFSGPSVNYVERYLSTLHFPAASFTSSSSSSSPMLIMLRRIRKLFVALLPIACEELCEIAESLIAPVKLGLARPSAPFLMLPSNSVSGSSNGADAGNGNLTDELFSVDTSVYSHQRDFLDSTFSMDAMMDDASVAQDNLPPQSSHVIWNTNGYESSAGGGNGGDSNSDNRTSASNNNRNAENAGPQSQAAANDVDISMEADLAPIYDLSHSNDSGSSVPPTATNLTTDAAGSSTSASGAAVSSNNNATSRPAPPPPAPQILIDRSLSDDQEMASDHDTGAPGDSQMVMELLVAHSEPDDNSNVGGRDTESDSESNPDDASYLSNADNASAQRSVVTGATAGSDVGVASLPYDDESMNSNPDDGDDDDDDEQDVEPDDDESSDSDDASDAAETEPDTDALSTFFSDPVERRLAQSASNVGATVSSSSGNANNRHMHNIMQHVQWALRSGRDLSSTSASNVPESSSYRRNAISNALASVDNVIQIGNSMVGLARAFSIIVRHIADLLVIVRDAHMEMNQIDFPHLMMSQHESRQLLQAVEERLGSTWFWLINCMDSTETQLRFGCALSNRRLAPSTNSSNPSSTTTCGNGSSGNGANSASSSSGNQAGSSNASQNLAHSRLPRMRTFQSQDEMAMLPNFNRNTLRRNNGLYVFNRPSTSATSSNAGLSGSVSNTVNVSSSAGSHSNESNNAAHRDFLNYAMSLMRAHSNEHYDSLPVLDVSSLKHVAYVFDAFVYFMRRGLTPDFPGHSVGCPNRLSSSNKEESCGRNHTFFRRSNSTLYLGCPRPDPFSAPYHEALPLASKPQLLQPNSRREQLFGIPRPSSVLEAEEMLLSLPAQMSLCKRHPWNGSSYQTSAPPNRSQSVITELPSNRSCNIVQPQPSPNKPSVIVMAGSAKHQQQQQSSSSTGNTTSSDNGTGKSSAPSKPQYFGSVQQQDMLLGRWRLTLELFGRLFVDDVSLEPNSIIHELSGFPIKESKFRRDMERLRITSSGTTQRDLNFYKLDRDRNALLIQTFKELNSVFTPVARRLSSQTTLVQQPLTITRVKVTFKDEPGEGAGVARSFYTAFSQAVLANERLPSELLLAGAGLSPGGRHPAVPASANYESYVLRLRSHSGNNSSAGSTSQRNSSGSNSAPPNSSPAGVNDSSSSSMRRPRSPALGRYRHYSTTSSIRRTQLLERIRNMHEPRNGSAASTGVGGSTTAPTIPLRRMSVLNYEAPPFVPTQLVSPRHSSFIPNDSRTAFGLRLYNRVYGVFPAHAAKITGMLMELYPDTIAIMNHEDDFRLHLDYAMEIIQINEGSRALSAAASGSGAGAGLLSHSEAGVGSSIDSNSAPAPPPAFTGSQVLPFLAADLVYEALGTDRVNSKPAHKPTSGETGSQLESSFADEDLDNAPLFYQPGTRGFYSPRAGRASEARLNAFRNVGRVIGICFVQNELCPITFNRHVIKMILGMAVAWHDLAFFDSDLYESLRQLILDAQSSNKEEIFNECDFNFTINLSPEEGGHEIELIPNGRNIRVTPQNVYDYVRRYAQYRMVESQEKAIMALRAGIFDVIPFSSFEGLTPEDFRLLLNGVNEINVQQLQAYVTFYDESGDPDPISVFRKWFWWVLERMTNEEKQDLIYFWTGSPALPASEEGFQPMPSVTIRPRDDYYFVTANTCISRLYIPLYSSRNILRQKLLMSIKSKSFDFI